MQSYPGTRWKTIRYFGMERNLEECYETQRKQPFKIFLVLQVELENAVSNNICSIIFGQRFDYKDKRFQDIMNRLGATFVYLFPTRREGGVVLN